MARSRKTSYFLYPTAPNQSNLEMRQIDAICHGTIFYKYCQICTVYSRTSFIHLCLDIVFLAPSVYILTHCSLSQSLNIGLQLWLWLWKARSHGCKIKFALLERKSASCRLITECVQCILLTQCFGFWTWEERGGGVVILSISFKMLS